MFCKIVAKNDDLRQRVENASCLAFTPNNQTVNGHLLVVPKRHHETIFDIPDRELSDVMLFTKKIAIAMNKDTDVTGVNILHASGISAQQSIPHFHLHLIPRFDDDHVNAWPDFPGGGNMLTGWTLSE